MGYIAKKKLFTGIKKISEVEDILRCTADPFYFILTWLKIIHQGRGLVGFNLYGFQKAVLKEFILNRFVISLKPRQMGLSTLTCAYILWMALFHPNKRILIISIKASVAAAMLRKIKHMYQHLPRHLQMEVVNGTDANSVGTSTELRLANGSEIAVSAATEDAGRSEALALLVMDEVAFQRYASSIWGSAQQTLATGGRAILISTAFGVGNFFHNMWVNAVQGLNGFKPLLLNWKMHPERDQAWYDLQRRLMGEKRTAQEIDCDFLKSGYNVFDVTKIKAIEDRLNERPPIEERLNGTLKIYQRPMDGELYTVGADVATGKARDFSAFSVLNDYGKEVACFKGKIGIREFGHLLMKTGFEYGQALLAPESNAIGEGVVAVAQENNYPNIYHTVSKTMKLDAFEKDESLIPGWLTTGKSRHEIITGMDDDLTDDLVEINNPFFVSEAYTFIYNEQNKAIALGKELGKGSSRANNLYEEGGDTITYTDDSILAACIGNEVRKNPARYRGNLPLIGGWD